ncbi:S41 family peptidase [Psychroflexus sediminis]|uniref:Peptidase family S41 n=1 Tax=Psychroflexus sediminis TaxID=470826 RepID=A0A1G7TYB8_9FLAO|nr:S41 family peptidase [Psychroflexus sediminis]SDG40355.1 Peptidase family S41 [Psychroflexus sediminis]
MKHLFVLLTFLGSLSLFAQPKLDTLAYQTFQNERFPIVNFETLGKEVDSASVIQYLSMEEKIQALSTVWHEAKFNFANFDLIPHVQWDSLYRAYLPKVIATEHIMETYTVLMQFNQHLRDGHTRILPPLYHFKKQKLNFVPIHFKQIEGKTVVYKVNSKDPVYSNITIGMVLEHIDGMPVQEYIHKQITPTLHFSTAQDSIGRIYHHELLRGAENTVVALDFKTPRGKLIRETFTRQPYDWNVRKSVAFKILPGNVGHLTIDSFANEDTFTEFKKHFPDILNTSALIIDVRHNGGGNGHWGHEIIGYLTKDPFYPSMTLMNTYHPSERAWGGQAIQSKKTIYDWKPYHTETYKKPVVVLISELTYSAAEDFSSAFKMAQRGVLIGTATGGSTGQPLGYHLPGGGVGFVCTKRDAMYDGTEFVGLGIQPDVEVKLTLEGLQNGKDEVLDAALKYVKQQKNKS